MGIKKVLTRLEYAIERAKKKPSSGMKVIRKPYQLSKH
jgi:hypothetical protein